MCAQLDMHLEHAEAVQCELFSNINELLHHVISVLLIFHFHHLIPLHSSLTFLHVPLH